MSDFMWAHRMQYGVFEFEIFNFCIFVIFWSSWPKNTFPGPLPSHGSFAPYFAPFWRELRIIKIGSKKFRKQVTWSNSIPKLRFFFEFLYSNCLHFFISQLKTAYSLPSHGSFAPYLEQFWRESKIIQFGSRTLKKVVTWCTMTMIWKFDVWVIMSSFSWLFNYSQPVRSLPMGVLRPTSRNFEEERK